MSLLSDQFTTADAAPITSPRTCDPGPGELVFTDTENKLSIASSQLVCAGGKVTPAWGDPGWYGRNTDDSAFARGRYVELEFQLDATGLYQMVGLSNSTTLSLANLKHCLYPLPDQQTLIRPQGDTSTDTYVAHLYLTTVYTLRIYALSGGGALYLIKGGQYGTTWRALGYSTTGSDASIYPAFLNYNGQNTIDNLLVETFAAPSLFYGYYNGETEVGSTYDIGAGVSLDGISLGRYNGNPVLTIGAGGAWDDAQVSHPCVLKDGATWKMWYGGLDGATFRIGYATSADGLAWTKQGQVLDVGGAGAFDESGVLFPVVYKDLGAVAAKRWKMFYAGQNAAGKNQIGYAYSSDGVSWTKGGANPVLANGAGGTWDDESLLPAGLVKSGSIYYLFYSGTGDTAYPVGYQCGLATFTDFEGTYTKSGSNPVLARRTGDQALTANTNSGSATVTVADTSAFVANEICMLCDAAGTRNYQQVRIQSIDSGTQITLDKPAYVSFTTANSARLTSCMRAIAPRCVVLEAGVWKQWGAGFQIGVGAANIETTYHATGSAADSGWAYSHLDCPPLWLPVLGRNLGWDARVSENLTWALDADTNQRVGLPSSAVVFRRTLSPLGTRTGSRQVHGWA